MTARSRSTAESQRRVTCTSPVPRPSSAADPPAGGMSVSSCVWLRSTKAGAQVGRHPLQGRVEGGCPAGEVGRGRLPLPVGHGPGGVAGGQCEGGRLGADQVHGRGGGEAPLRHAGRPLLQAGDPGGVGGGVRLELFERVGQAVQGGQGGVEGGAPHGGASRPGILGSRQGGAVQRFLVAGLLPTRPALLPLVGAGERRARRRCRTRRPRGRAHRPGRRSPPDRGSRNPLGPCTPERPR